MKSKEILDLGNLDNISVYTDIDKVLVGLKVINYRADIIKFSFRGSNYQLEKTYTLTKTNTLFEL